MAASCSRGQIACFGSYMTGDQIDAVIRGGMFCCRTSEGLLIPTSDSRGQVIFRVSGAADQHTKCRRYKKDCGGMPVSWNARACVLALIAFWT